MSFTNVTFEDVSDDGSNDRLTQILLINAINLEVAGVFQMDNVSWFNCSISFFSFNNLRGSATELKRVLFDTIVFKETTFKTRNNIITFGPLFSTEDVDFKMVNVIMEDLTFTQDANLIYVNMQTKYPLNIESWVFQNIVGGYISIDPLTLVSGSTPANLDLVNVTVKNNDFRYYTFIRMGHFSELNIVNCIMNRNSGYFRGTIISIQGSDSTANISNCNFNNNNAILGGLFYVARRSVINVNNSTLFSNFAVIASIAYVSNQGKINIDTWEVFRNKAVSVGAIEIFDSNVDSYIINSTFYSNSIITKEITIKELDDPSIWVNLCFASDGYLSYLSLNRTVLDEVVGVSLSICLGHKGTICDKWRKYSYNQWVNIH